MNHFDITQWTDFARGVTSDADRGVMDAHVVSGCARCRETLSLVTRVVESARIDNAFDPPDSVVRCAKALSALLSPTRSKLSTLVAHLVYDSLGTLAPVGLRSGDRVSRHGLYEAGDFCVDVRLEQERGSALATLVGQISNRVDPDSSLVEAPVLLMARKDIVAHTVYNRFGEFQMEYPPASDLRLRVALVPPGKRLELSLKRLVSEMPKPESRGKTPAGKQRRKPSE
jgi:hypothetical protein